jgi:hypothetical protein
LPRELPGKSPPESQAPLVQQPPSNLHRGLPVRSSRRPPVRAHPRPLGLEAYLQLGARVSLPQRQQRGQPLLRASFPAGRESPRPRRPLRPPTLLRRPLPVRRRATLALRLPVWPPAVHRPRVACRSPPRPPPPQPPPPRPPPPRAPPPRAPRPRAPPPPRPPPLARRAVQLLRLLAPQHLPL